MVSIVIVFVKFEERLRKYNEIFPRQKIYQFWKILEELFAGFSTHLQNFNTKKYFSNGEVLETVNPAAVKLWFDLEQKNM